MRVYLEGVGLLGPGLCGWQASRVILVGEKEYVTQPTVLTASTLLPAVERRRTGVPVKLALAVGEEAFTAARRDAASTATVFTSSSGDGDNVHHILELLASADREVSPTRFHNSVHNAAAGYWSLATQSRAPSTSLCAYDESFAAGVLDVATRISVEGGGAALIAYDHAYPEPLHSMRPIGGSFAVALVLWAERTERAFAALDVDFASGFEASTAVADAGLEVLRASVPAARCLPLLVALAQNSTGIVVLEYGESAHLTVRIAPCG